MNSPKDYLTDRQQKEKEMEQAEKMLIDTLGEEKARKLILDMKIGGILAGLQTNFMDLDTAQKKLFSLLTSEVERTLDIVEKEWVFKLKAWTKSDWYEFRKALPELKGGEK